MEVLYVKTELDTDFMESYPPSNPKVGKFTRLPGVGKQLEERFFDGDHILTLPRAKVIPADQSVQEPDQL